MGCSASQEQITSSIQKRMPDAKLYVDESTNFYIAQLFTGCLAEMTYYIQSGNEGAVIDPLRETDVYIEMAAKNNIKLKYIFLTHFHADFVSGHFDLAKKTGATIVFGPTAVANFDFVQAKDGQTFPLGSLSIKLLHTPGHTEESSCYLLLDGEREHAVFTGDTLFLGEVGRPDLAVKKDQTTKEDLAGMLYDSLTKVVKKLNPKTIVYPGHGAGSACGKKIQEGNMDTLENQLKTNYALQEMTKEQFVAIATANIPPPPQYFFHDVTLNKSQAASMEDVLKQSMVFLPVIKFLEKAASTKNAVILDSRQTELFRNSYLAESINIPLSANFASLAGIIFAPTSQFFIISEDGREQETITRLARIGYDNVICCLEGGIQNADKKYIKAVNSVEAAEVVSTQFILDVRNPNEVEINALEGATFIPLGQLEATLAKDSNKLPKEIPFYVHCKSGLRSVIAYSILSKLGYTNQLNILGGFDKLALNTNLKFVSNTK